MDAEKLEILDKIAKLLMVAEGDANENESNLARKMASKLMAKHQIAESEVFRDGEGDIVDDTEGIEVPMNDKGGRRQWVLDIFGTLAYTFDCKHYIQSWNGTCHFLGSEADVDTCVYFLEIIIHHVESDAWEMWDAERNWRKRNEFGAAAASVICQRLRTMKAEMDAQKERLKEQQEYAGGYDLMVVKNDLVDQAYEERSKDFRQVRHKKTKMTDRETWLAGMKSGENAPLNHAIGSNGDAEQLN